MTMINTQSNTSKVWFCWKPTSELFSVIITWLALILGLLLAFRVFTTDNVALNFITFGPVTLFGIGVVLPIIWTMKKNRPLSDVGITKNRAGISIILGVIFSAIQYTQTLATVTFPVYKHLVPLILMTLAVGLCEAVFFRGWIQLRLEQFFGIIPGIIFGSAFYSLYHIGYGMNWSELLFLFIIGLIFAVVFSLTKNVLILWPFFTPMGGLYTNIKEGLTLPFEASYGFILVLVLMLCFIYFMGKFYFKKTNN